MNRNLLRENGYIYPSFPGPGESHWNLALYAHDAEFRLFDTRHGIRTPTDRKRYRREFMQLFRYKFVGLKEHVILSSEHCSSFLVTVEEIKILKDLLAEVGQDIKVIFYARHQADFLISQYSANIIAGRLEKPSYPTETRMRDSMNYYGILMRWEEVFGRESIVARLFDQEKMAGGDVIKDFCGVLGIDDAVLAKATIPMRQNQRLDFETIEFLRLFNAHQPAKIDGEINPARGEIHKILQKLSSQRPNRAPKKIFARMREELNEPNSLFRERYIDGVKEDPFIWEEAPGKRGVKQLTIEDVFRLFANIWAGKIEEVEGANNRD